MSDTAIEGAAALFPLYGEAIAPQLTITACRDPKDNKFLEVAVAGRADVIVSGDKDLLVLHPLQGIAIESPRDFLARLEIDS